jgi:hypothetical protein
LGENRFRLRFGELRLILRESNVAMNLQPGRTNSQNIEDRFGSRVLMSRSAKTGAKTVVGGIPAVFALLYLPQTASVGLYPRPPSSIPWFSKCRLVLKKISFL